MRIKLLFVISSLINDGPTNYLYYLTKNIPKDNFDITICCMNEYTSEEMFISNGITVIQINQKKITDILALVTLVKCIKKIKPDIITTILIRADLYGRIASIFSKCIVYSIILNQDDYRLRRNIFEKLLVAIDTFLSNHRTKRIFVEAEGVRDFCIANQIIPKSRYFILNSMIDVPYEILTIDPKGSIDNAQPLIITAGRLHVQKNQQVLIKAIALLRKNHPSIFLEIWGEGPEKNKLQDLVNELDLCGNVCFKGFSRDLFKDLNKNCIYVTTSSWEGGAPITTLHAMALGLPVVTTRVGGVESFITDLQDGILLEQDKDSELCESVVKSIELLLKNEVLRKSLAKNVKERLVENFSANKVARVFMRYCEMDYQGKNPEDSGNLIKELRR